jgi:hypothetical protein
LAAVARQGRALFEPVDQCARVVRRDVVEVLVVDLQTGGAVASGEALGGLERKAAVGTGAADLHPQPVLERSDYLPRSSVGAGNVAAHGNEIVALGLPLQHRVEARRRQDLGGLEADDLGHLTHSVFGHMALDRLHQEQQWEDGRARVWIFADDLGRGLPKLVG